jgi:hypothetical protein
VRAALPTRPGRGRRYSENEFTLSWAARGLPEENSPLQPPKVRCSLTETARDLIRPRALHGESPFTLIVHNHASERTRGKKMRETPIFLTTSDRKSVERWDGKPAPEAPPPMILRRHAMKVPFLGRYPASPWLQARAALIGGLSYIGAAGAAAAAAASRGTLLEETLVAASSGLVSGLIGVLGIASARRMRKEGRRSVNKFAAVALVATLAACVAPVPSWSSTPPSGSPPRGRASGPALDCSDYDNIFTTPEAMKLPVTGCRRQ